MATIYSTPEELKVPSWGDMDRKEYIAAEAKYREDLKKFCKAQSNSTYAGKIVQFPCADSYAEYMIITMKPLALFHVPLGDAWDFPYMERLTVQDIKDKVSLSREFGCNI